LAPSRCGKAQRQHRQEAATQVTEFAGGDKPCQR
jgi:hypothetical protein